MDLISDLVKTPGSVRGTPLPEGNLPEGNTVATAGPNTAVVDVPLAGETQAAIAEPAADYEQQSAPASLSASPVGQVISGISSIRVPNIGADMDILPRAARRPHRSKLDRGLPTDEELVKLAKAYQERQRQLWPMIVQASMLPAPDAAALANMVMDFKDRHRTGVVDHQALRVYLKYCRGLGGDYNRYSCENSEPKSILDQMVEGLEKAAQEDHFVPWEYLFCDYSISGMDASRLGYSSYKKVLADTGSLIQTTYIADFTRASRDELEWWNLAALSKRLGKGLVGAEDGFRLDDPDWDMKLTMYGLLSRLFLKGLKQKVRRGMRSVARDGGSLGVPPLGYTRKIKRDTNGNVLYDRDGQPKTEVCIDPGSRDAASLLFESFAVKRWSVYKIAKEFNRQKIDGRNNWTDPGIRQMLWNPAYMGVFIWNRTRREYDWEKKKWTLVENPRSEWDVYYKKDLQFISVEWWKIARRRLFGARRPDGHARPYQRFVPTLFSDTLVCGYCGHPITLCRSGKYAHMYCVNGNMRARNCQLTTAKSVSIIEEHLLSYIRDALITEAALADLVQRANRFLEEVAKKPRMDVRPLKEHERLLEVKIRKLVLKVEDEADEQLCEGYDTRIKELQKELNLVRTQIHEIQASNAPSPEPLSLDLIKGYLADMRAVLQQEIPAAAEAIRCLTGPITIRQELIPGRKRGARWIATFSPNLMRFLARFAKDRNCPDSITLDLLSIRNWTIHAPASVEVRYVPRHERLATDATFLQELKSGKPASAIACMLHHPHGLVLQAVRFAKRSK